jgi:alcohol dehydrogenase (NADP+)
MRWEEYPVKEFKETDVEMDILTCGICYSEISTISSGWGEARYPLVVGHEIVGKVTRVGKEVQGVKVGQRLGVGAQCDSCGKCHHCS